MWCLGGYRRVVEVQRRGLPHLPDGAAAADAGRSRDASGRGPALRGVRCGDARASQGRRGPVLREAPQGAHHRAVFVKNVTDTRLSTCLGQDNVTVHTVEHLMFALEGLGVDNCRIEIQGGDEVSLLDGSARDWIEAIEESGLAIATNPTGAHTARDSVVVGAPISVTHGDSFVAAFPSPFTRLT